MKICAIKMATFGHSITADSFEIIFGNLFVSFGRYLCNNLTNVSLKLFQYCRFVDIHRCDF